MISDNFFGSWFMETAGSAGTNTLTILDGGYKVRAASDLSGFAMARHSIFCRPGDFIELSVRVRAISGNPQIRIDRIDPVTSAKTVVRSVTVSNRSFKEVTLRLHRPPSDGLGTLFSVGIGFNTAGVGMADFIEPRLTVNGMGRLQVYRCRLNFVGGSAVVSKSLAAYGGLAATQDATRIILSPQTLVQNVFAPASSIGNFDAIPALSASIKTMSVIAPAYTCVPRLNVTNGVASLYTYNALNGAVVNPNSIPDGYFIDFIAEF